MKVATSSEMKLIDATCGIAGIELMEHAAEAVAALAERAAPEGSIVVVAGRGNNGGDGLAAARLLTRRGREVVVFLNAMPDALAGDAAVNYRRAVDAAVAFVDRSGLAREIERGALLVDALFGTGFRIGGMSAETAALVSDMNRARRILSIDIPSGVCADTGRADAAHIHADLTIALGTPKRAHLLLPGASACGRIFLSRIGMRDECFAHLPGEASTDRAIAALLPERKPDAHKGASRLLIAGGRSGMTGAVQLAAAGAFAANAGYVFLSMPEGSGENGFPVEAVRRVLPSRGAGAFSVEAGEALLHSAEGMHAAVIGGGMGRGDDERAVAKCWIESLRPPTVVDADALSNAELSWFANACGPRVLTPHAGEFEKLFGIEAGRINDDRVDAALLGARKTGHVLLLKGRPTVVASPCGRYALIASGDERLATCGSGDVLAGVIGALLAQGLSPFDAATAGAHLHGRAVDAWEKPVGLTASAIAELIPECWRRVIASESALPFKIV